MVFFASLRSFSIIFPLLNHVYYVDISSGLIRICTTIFFILFFYVRTHHERTHKASSDSHSIYGPQVQQHSLQSAQRSSNVRTVSSSTFVPIIRNKRKQADDIILSRSRVTVLTYSCMWCPGCFSWGMAGHWHYQSRSLHPQSIVDLCPLQMISCIFPSFLSVAGGESRPRSEALCNRIRTTKYFQPKVVERHVNVKLSVCQGKSPCLDI